MKTSRLIIFVEPRGVEPLLQACKAHVLTTITKAPFIRAEGGT